MTSLRAPRLALLRAIRLAPLLLLAATPPRSPRETMQLLIDHARIRAPDLDRVGTWLGTDRPLLFREALKGRVVVLDFWTSGCVNCVHALPVYRALEQRFAGQPFQVIGIHSGKFDQEKTPTAVAEAMARLDVRHPVGVDGDHVVWDEYAIHGWPTAVLVDARGYIVSVVRGEPELEPMAAWIDALLADGRAKGVLADGPPAFRSSAAADTGPLAFPGKVLALPGGGLAVSDTGHHRVLVLGSDLSVQREIGSGLEGFSDGPAEAASFRGPQGLATRGDLLWVADAGNHAVRRVDLRTGEVTTVAGTGKKAERTVLPAADARTVALRSPWDLAVVGDALWVAMAGAHQLWVLDLGSGAWRLGAGSGREGLDDGPSGQATFSQPSGLATDGQSLFVADPEASALRRVDVRSGTVTTLAGTGLFDFGDRDGPLKDARFQHPEGLTLAGDTLFVADTFNGKIRRVALGAGTVTSLGTTGALARPGGLAVLASPPRSAAGAGAAPASGLPASVRLVAADTEHHRLVAVDGATGALTPLALPGVHAPRLRGVERPVLAVSRTLPLQHLGDAPIASGDAELVVEVGLPAGDTFTAGAPQRAEVSVEGPGATLRGPARIETAGAGLRVVTPVRTGTSAAEAVHTVALYWCREGDAAVCLVDRRRLVARLQPSPEGPRTAIVRYRPAAPAR